MVEMATSSTICFCHSRLFVDYRRWAITLLAPRDPLTGNRNRRGAEVSRRKYWGPKGRISNDVMNFWGKYHPREAYGPNKHCPVRPITGHGRSCVYKMTEKAYFCAYRHRPNSQKQSRMWELSPPPPNAIQPSQPHFWQIFVTIVFA